MAREDPVRLIARGREALLSGRSLEAKTAFMEAVELVESTCGEESEELIEPLMHLGHVLRLESKDEAALEASLAQQSRALSIAEKCFGAADPRWVHILGRIARTCEVRRRYDDAVRHLARALQIQRTCGGDVSFELVNLVHVLLNASRPRDALPYALEGLSLAERRAHRDDELIGPLLDVGLTLRESGQPEEALGFFRRALAIAVARKDVPELREARQDVEDEIRTWISELEVALGGQLPT